MTWDEVSRSHRFKYSKHPKLGTQSDQRKLIKTRLFVAKTSKQQAETIFIYLPFIFRWQYIKTHDLKSAIKLCSNTNEYICTLIKMSSNIYKQKKTYIEVNSFNCWHSTHIKWSRYKSPGKMKKFVRWEYLVKFNTINLVNGYRARLDIISSGTPL